MSADGKIAGPERKQVRISSQEDIDRVKVLRKTYDSILVGVGTVIADDPHLTVKNLTYDENPVRIVLDTHGRTPDTARVLDDRARTIIVTGTDCTREWPGAEVLRSPDLASAMESLGEMGIKSMLVEGGGEVISSFFRAGIVDRYSVFVGSQVIGGRTAPTPADGDGRVTPDGLRLKLESSEVLGDGVLITYTPLY
ncbi:MAG: diaminohydroxyphosphoribosylaminopyrimidine reductase [Thermoplasmata archaeon]|nr:diaminohydroxyphosphoribosylaminopyrimidine reductase [Thermoplasmata archaeon]